MLDRFQNAQWYIGGGDELNTIIYDASDLEGTGPLGHGMVCQDAVIEDARLIVLAPTLLRIVKTLLASWECDPDEDAQYEDLMDKAVGEAREAIAKAEGWSQCQDGQHRGRVHHDPRLRFGPPLDTCIDCMEEEAADHTNTRIQVGCGYIIVDREECQNMRHVEEGE